MEFEGTITNTIRICMHVGQLKQKNKKTQNLESWLLRLLHFDWHGPKFCFMYLTNVFGAEQ